jgi:hypothetical protein
MFLCAVLETMRRDSDAKNARENRRLRVKCWRRLIARISLKILSPRTLKNDVVQINIMQPEVE